MASEESHAPRRAGSRRRLATSVSEHCILLAMYMLLAIGYVVTAQPTFAPSSSTETTSQPSSPSPSPSINPTQSFSPSSEPSSSFLPTLTESVAPSLAPSKSPMPSSSPTVSVIIPADLFNIAMVLEGFPSINAAVNETSANKTLWEMITSNHVSTYWSRRNYTNFDITAVTTNFQAQLSHFPDVPEESEESDQIEQEETATKIVYDQRIIYWVDGTSSPVPDIANETNTTVLFTRPFHTDSQRYCDNLRQAFNLSDQVFMIGFWLIPFETPAPTPSTPPNGGGGGYTTDDGLDGGVIAAIVVVCIAFVVLVLFFGVWYMTHRKEEHIIQDEVVREPGQMVVVDEPPGFRLQDLDYSEPVTNYDPATSDSHIPEAEEPRKINEDDQPYDRQGSLHVGIPLDDEGPQEYSDDDEEEDSSHSEEDESFGMSEMQQPSMAGFALQIHELED